jgi:hypothetical protein
MREQSRMVGKVTERYWLFEAPGCVARIFVLDDDQEPTPTVETLRLELERAIPVETDPPAEMTRERSTDSREAPPAPEDHRPLTGADRLLRAMQGERTRTPRHRRPRDT